MELLKRIEKIREKANKNPNQYPIDYTIRLIEAMIAEEKGYKNRNEWESKI